jgi:hypothetical protein
LKIIIGQKRIPLEPISNLEGKEEKNLAKNRVLKKWPSQNTQTLRDSLKTNIWHEKHLKK